MQHEIDLPDRQNLDATMASRIARGNVWTTLAYYVGVPLAIALYAGLNNWEIRHAAGTLGSLSFYAAHAFLPWWTTCGFTLLFMRLLQRWKPPWLALLILGHVASSFMVVPYSNWLTGLYEASLPELALGHTLTVYFSADFWAYLSRAGIIWLGINFLFDRFLKLPLYRYSIPRGYEDTEPTGTMPQDPQIPSESGWPEGMPAFIHRLPKQLQPDEVLIIKAEQHYIKVVTPNKNYMVLYRFSDAINEIGQQLGQQVHRSYWVNTNAIASVNAKAKDFFLVMRNNEHVPVSGPYQGMVRELARSTGLPLKG